MRDHSLIKLLSRPAYAKYKCGVALTLNDIDSCRYGLSRIPVEERVQSLYTPLIYPYDLRCNESEFESRRRDVQARQTRPNSGGVADGHPRFDKGGFAIMFYFLRVKNITF